jgi:chorismate-pyruvate lyase
MLEKTMTMQVKTLLRLAFEHPELLPGVLMTPLLEASAGVPLQERVLFHQLHPLAAAIPELVLDQGEPILERKVLLQGMVSGISYLYTELLIVPGVLPLHVSTRLLPGVEPLETIMQECRLPTVREIIAHGRACLGEIADQTVAEHFGMGLDADVLYRTSLLYLNQRPHCVTMRMTEMLPLACVAEQHGAAVLDQEQFRTQPLS